MLTPVQYAERYWNLQVPIENDSVQVRIDRYHLGEADAAKDRLWSGLKRHFQEQQKVDKGYRLRLRVNSVPVEFPSVDQMLRRVVSPFYGKGSPEDCQIVLQLAVLLGEATREGLQRYCDSHLGLDCNGFVGNYLWHERAGNAWNVDSGQGDIGPSSLIDSIMTSIKKKTASRSFVSKIEELDSKKTYLLAEVDSSNNIMPGGPGRPPGHLAITEQGRYMAQSFVFDSMGGLDFRRRDIYGHPAYWAVESTGRGVGLTQSWYAIGSVKHEVFRVFRGSQGHWLPMKIVELPN